MSPGVVPRQKSGRKNDDDVGPTGTMAASPARGSPARRTRRRGSGGLLTSGGGLGLSAAGGGAGLGLLGALLLASLRTVEVRVWLCVCMIVLERQCARAEGSTYWQLFRCLPTAD